MQLSITPYMVFIPLIALLSSCGGSSGDTTTETNNTTDQQKAAQFIIGAKYDDTTTKTTRAETTFGQDADEDGGVWTAITPSNFKVAFKSATLTHKDGTTYALIPDSGTLTNSTVIDLSTDSYVINSSDIPNGEYESISAEIYYHQITMPMNIPVESQVIRVYLSDDDFSAEGNLGHHQGDITLIGADGIEKGWAIGDKPWIVSNVSNIRSETQNGAAGVDQETGHARGYYGDTDLWNNALIDNGFTYYDPNQGSEQDIYNIASPLNLTVTDDSQFEVTITFDLTNAWLFEDFDPTGTDGHGVFNPSTGGIQDTNNLNPNSTQLQDAAWYNDTAKNGAEWTPVFDMPTVTQK